MGEGIYHRTDKGNTQDEKRYADILGSVKMAQPEKGAGDADMTKVVGFFGFLKALGGSILVIIFILCFIIFSQLAYWSTKNESSQSNRRSS